VLSAAQIMDCVMDLRVDDMYHVGVKSAGSSTVFSPYIVCRPRLAYSLASYHQLSYTSISVGKVPEK
jgi:hypothetical protein